MRFFTIIILLLCFTAPAFAQDLIILKKEEKQIQCKILQVNDTLIIYHPTGEKKPASVKRVEVLSFLVNAEPQNGNQHSGKSVKVVPQASGSGVGVGVIYSKKKQKVKDPDAGIIGRYRSGEKVPGYMILSGGDTVVGSISVSNMASNQVHFYFTDSLGNKTRYDASNEQVIGYGYDLIHYRKVSNAYHKEVSNGLRSERATLFLHIIEDGPAKLYRFYTLKFPGNVIREFPEPPIYLGKIKSYYLMENPQGEKLINKGRSIKGCVNRLLYDNAALMNKIRMKGLKEYQLRETFQEYNQWHSSKSNP